MHNYVTCPWDNLPRSYRRVNEMTIARVTAKKTRPVGLRVDENNGYRATDRPGRSLVELRFATKQGRTHGRTSCALLGRSSNA